MFAFSPKPPEGCPHDSGTVGLLAGWGEYPLLLARGLRQRGSRVVCLGVHGHADRALAELCDEFTWVGMGKIGRAIRYFRRRGVRQAMMAGKIHKVTLFSPGLIWRHFPDWRTFRAFFQHFVGTKKDRKDDTLLRVIVDEFAKDGITFVPATDHMPELLVKYGKLTRKGLSKAQQKDIEFGWQLAREMGRLDIGQSVAVKSRAVLAVEAIEGTDACIRRAGALCTSGGITVVKVAKPQQDMRFDVPTVGVGTLQAMLDAGARVLAIEAGKTIMLHPREVIAFADRHGLAIVALSADGACEFVEDETARAA